MVLGAGTKFERLVHVGGELRLGKGVRGEGPLQVVAYAAGRISLGEGILIRGKVASDLEVVITA